MSSIQGVVDLLLRNASRTDTSLTISGAGAAAHDYAAEVVRSGIADARARLDHTLTPFFDASENADPLRRLGATRAALEPWYLVATAPSADPLVAQINVAMAVYGIDVASRVLAPLSSNVDPAAGTLVSSALDVLTGVAQVVRNADPASIQAYLSYAHADGAFAKVTHALNVLQSDQVSRANYPVMSLAAKDPAETLTRALNDAASSLRFAASLPSTEIERDGALLRALRALRLADFACEQLQMESTPGVSTARPDTNSIRARTQKARLTVVRHLRHEDTLPERTHEPLSTAATELVDPLPTL